MFHFDALRIQQTDLAGAVLDLLRRYGATDGDVYVEHRRDSVIKLRDGEIRELKQSQPRGIGIRYYAGQRSAFAYSSDIGLPVLEHLIASARERAAHAPEVPFDRISDAPVHPTPEEVSERLLHVTTEEKEAYLRTLELAARGADTRIFTTEPTFWGDAVSVSTFASTRGAMSTQIGTGISVYTAPVAEEGGKKVRGAKGAMIPDWDRLPDAAVLGREAGLRCAGRLGARKVPSARIPVLFSEDAAGQFIGSLLEAFSGDAVSKKASFLASKLGQSVASPQVNLVDDPTLPHGLRSASVDDEGTPTSKTYLLRNGVVENFLYDLRTANKVGAIPTGHGYRGSYMGLPGIRTSNVILEPGTSSTEELLAAVGTGFYVTGFLGFGFDVVRGEMSMGAEGFWIESGVKAYPVHEVTLASGLLQLLAGITHVGREIEFDGTICSPEFVVAEMALSGL